MLGQKRFEVDLVEYTNVWKQEFLNTKKELESILQDQNIVIEHIGSTSIENLISKPIIDVGIGLETKDNLRNIVDLLVTNGYTDHGDRKNRGGYLVVKFIGDQIISHHIHILEKTDQQWLNYLKFRNKLRQDKSMVEEYARLKSALHLKFKKQREQYTKGKHDFIQGVLE